MGNVRRLLCRSDLGTLAVQEEPIPQLLPGQILVQVETSVISTGTELRGLHGDLRSTGKETKWRAFGYQNAGVVVSVGPQVTDFKEGDRVACMGAGYAVHGTYAAVPVNLAVRLPDSVTFEEGATIALAATALNAVQRARIQLGEFVLVMGLGLIGQFTAQFASIAGAHVLVVDQLPMRVERALACGAEQATVLNDDFQETVRSFTRGYGIDAAFICFGGEATQAMKQIAQVMKVAPDGHIYGRVVVPGGASVTHSFGAALGNLDILSAARTGPGYHDHAYEHGHDYPPVFVPWTTKRNLEECVAWMANQQLRASQLITHRFPLDDAVQGCEMIVQSPDKVLGAALVMNH